MCTHSTYACWGFNPKPWACSACLYSATPWPPQWCSEQCIVYDFRQNFERIFVSYSKIVLLFYLVEKKEKSSHHLIFHRHIAFTFESSRLLSIWYFFFLMVLKEILEHIFFKGKIFTCLHKGNQHLPNKVKYSLLDIFHLWYRKTKAKKTDTKCRNHCVVLLVPDT